MKKVSVELHARLVKGEDADKLQKEAYVDAGLPGNPPKTEMEKVRRNTLPANHKEVMDLKPGEVSEVIADPSGYYIYKLVSKETLPLDAVKAEIRGTISSQRYRDSMKAFQDNVDMNDAYFGPSRNPAMPPPPRGAKPPAQQVRRSRLRRPLQWIQQNRHHLITGVSGNLGQRLVPSSQITRWWASMSRRPRILRLINSCRLIWETKNARERCCC